MTKGKNKKGNSHFSSKATVSKPSAANESSNQCSGDSTQQKSRDPQEFILHLVNLNSTRVSRLFYGHKDQMLQDTFDDEVQWCVNKLTCGLKAKGANEKSKQEALRVMSVLTSQSAPLVKKRALMRSTFGDYRKKMTKERSSHEKEFLNGLKMYPATSIQSSTFIKKVDKLNNTSSMHSEFRFNFEDDA